MNLPVKVDQLKAVLAHPVFKIAFAGFLIFLYFNSGFEGSFLVFWFVILLALFAAYRRVNLIKDNRTRNVLRVLLILLTVFIVGFLASEIWCYLVLWLQIHRS